MMMTLAAGGMGASATGLLVVLACAGAIALVMARLRVAALPAYLVGGAIIGPTGLGLGVEAEAMGGLAQLATVMLMFGIGLHLDLSAFRRGAAATVTAGVVSTVAVASLVTGSLMVIGVGWVPALVLGMAVSMSSTAVVLNQLQRRREIGRAHGRLIFGVLLVQDLLVIVMLALLPMIAVWGGIGGEPDAAPGDGGGTLADVSLRLAGVVGLVVVGKLGLPRLFEYSARHASSEVTLVLGAAAALGAAVLSTVLGLSAELGAFLAGFLLAATPVRYQLSGQIGPLRDLFMAVFFTVVGMQLDLPLLLGSWWVVLLGAAAVMVGKALVIAATAWLVGASGAVSGRAGVGLAQVGEFSLVILAVAVDRAMVSPEQSGVLIAVVVATLIATPGLLGLMNRAGSVGSRIPTAPWYRSPQICEAIELVDEDAPDDEELAPSVVLSGHVIIAGFGPIGRACAERLDAEDIGVVVVELNARTVRAQLANGRRAVFGDASNAEVLERAGIASCDGVVLTIPDDEQTLRAVRTVRSLRPDVMVAARTATLSRANLARQQGVTDVVVEELATAREMSECVITNLRGSRGSRDAQAGSG